MGLSSLVKRIFLNTVPVANRAAGGVFITHLPTGAGTKTAAAQVMTAGGANAFGAVAAILAATANLTECWAEGFILSAATVAKLSWHVCVTTATAIATGTAALPNVFASVPVLDGFAGATANSLWAPLPAHIYIPAGKAINIACASSSGGKKISAWLVISRNR